MAHNVQLIRTNTGWKSLFKIAGAAGLAMLGIMVAQIAVFIIWPPPVTVNGFFTLFQQSWLLGLLSLDLLYILNNALLILIYLALYIALKRVTESGSLIALVLGLVGISAYFASNPAFEMLSLSGQYASAENEVQRTVLLGAGESLLATYRGTAFDVYYVLNAAALLIFAVSMLRSDYFPRPAAVAGIVAGILMIIPSTAGTIGLIFSLASLVPWALFLILIIPRLLRGAEIYSR